MKLIEYIGFEEATVAVCLCNFLINLLPDFWIVNKCVRPAIARLLGMKCGSGVFIQRNVFFGNPRNVEIGDKSIICRGSFLDGSDKIIIGKNVSVAFQSTLITSSHEIGPEDKREGKLVGGRIVIGDGVWVAARVVIGPGTVIGSGSVLSAGTVLMHSVPANSLVAGVPGRVVTKLEKGPYAGFGAVNRPATAPVELPAKPQSSQQPAPST